MGRCVVCGDRFIVHYGLCTAHGLEWLRSGERARAEGAFADYVMRVRAELRVREEVERMRSPKPFLDPSAPQVGATGLRDEVVGQQHGDVPDATRVAPEDDSGIAPVGPPTGVKR